MRTPFSASSSWSLRLSAVALGLTTLAVLACSEDEQSLADAKAGVGAAGESGAGSANGAGSSNGAGAASAAGTGAGSSAGTGSGANTGAGSSAGTGSGANTGAGSSAGTGAGSAAGSPGGGPSPQCPGPNLFGCSADIDCGEGSSCENDPTTCHPSACTCVDDVWSCTKDCLGGVCIPKGTGPSTCNTPNPQGCSADADCGTGQVCQNLDDGCHASSCQCNDGAWGCTKDCLPGTCVTPSTGPNTCSTPSPVGCSSDADCGPSTVCKDLDDGCHPSSCQCNDGVWGCTKDCLPRTCAPSGPGPETCTAPNPEGCTADSDCSEGAFCVVEPGTCRASSCQCSEGSWVCTKDCGGGVCKAKTP